MVLSKLFFSLLFIICTWSFRMAPPTSSILKRRWGGLSGILSYTSTTASNEIFKALSGLYEPGFHFTLIWDITFANPCTCLMLLLLLYRWGFALATLYQVEDQPKELRRQCFKHRAGPHPPAKKNRWDWRFCLTTYQLRISTKNCALPHNRACSQALDWRPPHLN